MDVEMRIVRLTRDYEIGEFDCGNKDLNDFLLQDSKDYQSRLLSVTYIVEDSDNIAAYFSMLNDKISIAESDKATWRKIKKIFGHSKHRSDYPAVKVGRLAVDAKYQHMALDSNILDFIKIMFKKNNRAGCAFLTVDALKDVLPFYLRNNFKMMRRENLSEESETYQLYYDLSQLL